MRNNYRPQQRSPKQFFFVNNRIQEASLRVLGSDGEQFGVLTREEALAKAQEQGLDLVLIAPKAVPPVAKLTDFKKFMYEQEKKLKEAKKGAKKSTVKDIKISLFIATADLERMINRTREFIDDGNQVRLNLALKGREIVKKDMAMELIHNYIKQLGDVNISKEPRFEGRVVRAVVAKKK